MKHGWQTFPYKIKVKKGQTVAFCACNKTARPPYCDGAHAKENTGKHPFIVTFEEDKTIKACGCRLSNNRPYCDGTHSDLQEMPES
ncbi:MAG: CDGSH iron-sulfur domain-containing protein [Epsilonproteobacteria bacterium]|nr:MAG: CDGSH iron-sulfur domain-containing protein [Campylobacterota bacterium]RLA65310.1 MAG: CDGSH iron-sulfur domain-containing protein [Campylobacterota bacterium]